MNMNLNGTGGGFASALAKKSPNNTMSGSTEKQATNGSNGAANGGSQILIEGVERGGAETSNTRVAYLNLDKTEGAKAYVKAKQELDNTIVDLDQKLHRVIAKQEYEYLKGYNVYVKQKERELKDTIIQLSERYNN